MYRKEKTRMLMNRVETPNENNIPNFVTQCLLLATLLEVSGYPKPGNVHRTADFQDTRYEHFLASAVAVTPFFRRSAHQGVTVREGTLKLHQIEIGRTINNAVSNASLWQHGKNTLLGSIILLTPMAVAAGLTLAKKSFFPITEFRKNLKAVVESTTSNDAANLYDAIALAQPGGLGKVSTLDVTDANSKKKILHDGISLYEIFKISSSWDSVASEWVSNYHITFDIGYKYLKKQLEEKININTATVHTFLKVLSEVPDTLIARKTGKARAKWVSTEAGEILKAGGLTTKEGKRRLLDLDRKLRDPNHTLNPGTTADITAATLAVAILNGYRP